MSAMPLDLFLKRFLVSPPDRQAAVMESALALLDNKTPEQAPADRLLRRGEVARRLGCTPRTIDALGRSGALKRVTLPGRKRGAGFSELAVAALVAGKAGTV